MAASVSTIYGSKTYESLVLSHMPTAVFGPYASATNKITDLTNRNYLVASLATGASYSRQIPFFALASEDYTFDTASSNKITITENSSSYSKSVGVGKFGSGDEGNSFSVEFLLSKNYDFSSNADFARFGFNGSQHSVGISYSNIANEFYLNVYSIDGYIRYRSSVPGGLSKTSNHIVLNFLNGRPILYVNGNRDKKLIDELTNKVFLGYKTAGRTVAEFSCSDNNQHLLVSMIAFYNYALPESAISNHYNALFDIGDFKNYIAKLGSPLLYENIPYSQKISRNTDNDQSFWGTAIYGIDDSPRITVNRSPNFIAYGLDSTYLNAINYSGSYGVASTGGFSLKSTDIGEQLISKGISFSVGGVGTGRYTKENVLLFVENSSVGDFYVAIDSSSSKFYIGTGSSTVLASMSASVAQKPPVGLIIGFSGSSIYLNTSDGSSSATYNFGSDIYVNNNNVYLFNRYYNSPSTGLITAGGNSEFDFNKTYADNENWIYAGLTTPYLDSSSTLIWNAYQKRSGLASINTAPPTSSQNFFYANSTSDNTQYVMYIDGASTVINNESIINIPNSSSYIYINASLTTYWNDTLYNTRDSVALNNFALYGYGAASYTAGSYPAVLEISNGLINTPDNFLNIFKQNNIGFMQSYRNILKISKSSPDFANIGQVDFLIAIPNALSASTQYLIDNGSTASMTLTYNSTSFIYILNFNGMSASVNGISATSGTTRILPRQHYFIQSTFNTPISDAASFVVFSKSDGTASYAHSFDRLSVFPSTASYANSRYAQIFGRKIQSVSDDSIDYFRVQSVPDDIELINKTWQVYNN